METQYLSGMPISEKVLNEVRIETQELIKKGIKPGLGTILVGEDSASAGYVRKKKETCESVGIASFNKVLPSTASQSDLIKAVNDFNMDDRVDAFLIQNPVPGGFDFSKAVEAIDTLKDADGLHPSNLGRLVLQEEGPVPCTPAGIIEILKYYGISIQGKHAVVVGRGPTLGRPLALMLSMKRDYANAAVTVVHTGVPNLADYTRMADVLICAVGVPSFIMPDMVKPGAIVVSGGIQWKGKRLLPDVDESVGTVTSWITPRLGGVGPTTVAMLLKNTVLAAKKRREIG